MVTNHSPNPDKKGDRPNKPSTINLLESGRKNWADKGSYNN